MVFGGISVSLDLVKSTGFKELDKHDIKSRLQFSVSAAAALVFVTPQDVLLHMTAGGEDALIPYLKAELEGHALHDEDYRRIYRIVKHCVMHPQTKFTPEQMERM